MNKTIVLITVVLLIASTTAFGGSYGGGTQTQIAFTGVAQGSVAWGSGASFSQYAGGSTYANQQMYTQQGALSQTTKPSVFGGGSGTTGWYGVVASGWAGLSGSYQTQSLPQSKGYGGRW